MHGSETSVAALATTEADSFGQVRESIDGMIRELKQQQLLDSKRKDWCKQEFFEIQRDSEAASDHQTALELRTTQMADDLKTLQADLEQTVAKREELQHQLQTAGDERKEEQAAFQQTHLDQQMTLRALKQAWSSPKASVTQPSRTRRRPSESCPGSTRHLPPSSRRSSHGRRARSGSLFLFCWCSMISHRVL